MPRYFFDTSDALLGKDRDGVVLADLQTARLEAVRLSSEVLRDDPGQVGEGREWRCTVRGETGAVVFLLRVIATRSAPWRCAGALAGAHNDH